MEYRQYLISFGFGAAQQNISQDEIKKFKILFPKKEIAQSFTYMVHPFVGTSLKLADDLLLEKSLSLKSLLTDIDVNSKEKPNG